MLEEVKLCPNHFQWKGTVFFFGGGGMFLYCCCLFVVAGVLWVAGIFKSRLNKRKRRTSFELSNVFEGLLFGSDAFEGHVPQHFEDFDQNIRRMCCDILGRQKMNSDFPLHKRRSLLFSHSGDVLLIQICKAGNTPNDGSFYYPRTFFKVCYSVFIPELPIPDLLR